MTPADDSDDPPLVLGAISTSWRQVHDPLRFVLTYGPAVRSYLGAILRDPDAAEEVLQDLLVQVTERGFPTADPARGRFRDYLRAVVRNAARRHLRRAAGAPAADVDPDRLPGDTGDGAERAWRAEWRRCLLDKAWRALERHQRQTPGSLAYTALRLAVDHPDLDSQEVAARAAGLAGRAVRPEAFRQQLSRARRRFAELIAQEVRETLDGPTDGQVRAELANLDLLAYLQDYLPVDG